ncbi:MAG: phosphopantothenoylcysteine decarboxylase [Planctomycetota bacterium]
MRILVTAGPTREAIDPVRYLGNRSSGKMGYALAKEALAAGHQVTLVSGPVDLPWPGGVQGVRVESAQEMLEAVMMRQEDQDAFILAAAVADYRPRQASAVKVRKSSAPLTLELVPTPDILAHLGHTRKIGQVLAGFCLDTGDPVPQARNKLSAKRCDLILANSVETLGSGMIQGTLVTARGTVEPWPSLEKEEAARRLVKAVVAWSSHATH